MHNTLKGGRKIIIPKVMSKMETRKWLDDILDYCEKNKIKYLKGFIKKVDGMIDANIDNQIETSLKKLNIFK